MSEKPGFENWPLNRGGGGALNTGSTVEQVAKIT